jgi:hypothetical protein
MQEGDARRWSCAAYRPSITSKISSRPAKALSAHRTIVVRFDAALLLNRKASAERIQHSERGPDETPDRSFSLLLSAFIWVICPDLRQKTSFAMLPAKSTPRRR